MIVHGFEVNVNKEGEAAADYHEEDRCADEMTDVVRPMDYEVKTGLRRDVIHHVAVQSPLHGVTGSCVRSHHHSSVVHGFEDPSEV